jgi:hypothetical protein
MLQKLIYYFLFFISIFYFLFFYFIFRIISGRTCYGTTVSLLQIEKQYTLREGLYMFDMTEVCNVPKFDESIKK